MKLFIDSGNLKDIESLVPLGIIDGITTNPSEAWMLQIVRNACDVDDGVLSRGRKLLIDRDAK